MLESIVAIMILSLSVSGAFSAVTQSLSQAIIAKDEVNAFYLAQEAVEIIRNKRDNNQLARIKGGSNTWLTGITDASNCPFNQVCKADVKAASPLIYCGASWNSCDNLKQDPTTFLYGYTSGSATNFKREIMLEPIPGTSDEISITVRISWTKGSMPFEFKIKAHLFNWI